MKTVMTNLARFFKATVISAAAFSFLAGGIMLCCLPVKAHAAPVKASHCHPAKAGDQSSKDDSKCGCCKVKSSPSDTLVKQAQNLLSGFKSFHAMVANTSMFCRHVVVSHLAYTGPPSVACRLPIYLRHSCLRL